MSENGKYHILVLNGPNLNMLGTREPEKYGRKTLADIEAGLRSAAAKLDAEIDFRQSNSEGELVSWIQDAGGSRDAIIINAGGYSHTSIAILDALTLVGLPIIEVHISNIFRRENFRHQSFVSKAATGVICGLGGQGYILALEAAHNILAANR